MSGAPSDGTTGLTVRHSSALVIAACPTDAVLGPVVADVVIAADSGVDVARRLGRHVDIVVGDLDSASASGLTWASSQGATVQRHPVSKNETDLELALALAVDRAASVHVLASAGGRLDHTAATLSVLSSPRWAAATLSATIGSAHVDVVRGLRSLSGAAGETISLLAMGGPAEGVRTNGLQYPMDGEMLAPGEARGVSNVIVDPPPTVEVASGVLLAIRPGPDSHRSWL